MVGYEPDELHGGISRGVTQPVTDVTEIEVERMAKPLKRIPRSNKLASLPIPTFFPTPLSFPQHARL